MVKKIILLDKLYNISSKKQEEELQDRYQKYIFENTKGFSRTTVKIKKLRNYDKRFELNIDGPEENFIYNLLSKEIGRIQDFKDVKVNDVLKGTMIDVGKVGFGIFIDCGIVNPPSDVLINLHRLRKQLCSGKQVALPKIIQSFEFIDHFPVYIKVIEIHPEKNEIQGELEQKSLKIFKKVVDEDLEGIFIGGATKSQLKKALISKGHLRDIISIKRFGFFENIVLFKEGTDAPGIISQIGSLLKGSKISAIRGKRIKSLFE